MKTNKKATFAALGIAALTTASMATAEPVTYQAKVLESGYQITQLEGSCGGKADKKEAKCGADHKKKAKEGKCGEAKCGADHKAKAKEGKCGEGKCGGDKKADKKKSKEGKCGEAKCGGAI